MKNLSMHQKKTVINLLENALCFINEVPNHKYKTIDFHCSYDLADEISEVLKELKNDSRKKDRKTV